MHLKKDSLYVLNDFARHQQLLSDSLSKLSCIEEIVNRADNGLQDHEVRQLSDLFVKLDVELYKLRSSVFRNFTEVTGGNFRK